MRNYANFIKDSPLVEQVQTTTTTGDLEYNGTALEVTDSNGTDLFHVVVDAGGQQQILFLESDRNFRIPLALMEEIVQAAKDKVKVA